MDRLNQKLGFLSALPIFVVLLLSFVAPLLVVAGFSVMPQKVFSLANVPDFSAYLLFFLTFFFLLFSFFLPFAPAL